MNDRELMQQALEKLEFFAYMESCSISTEELITAMRERLVQPEHESVKFNCTVIDDDNPDGVPLSKWCRQPEQEPFCYHDGRNIVGKEFADHSDVFPLYTTPPPRKPLTDEEIWDEVKAADLDWQTGWSLDEDAPNRYITFARAIEAAHGITGDKA